MIEAFHFLRPDWLWLLPLAAGLIWAIAWRSDTQRTWRKLVAPHLLEVLLVNTQRGNRLRPLTLLAVLLALGIVALSGPSWRQQASPFTQDAASLVIVLKVTPSMLTDDLQPTRVERAVHKIRDLLERRPGSRAALIAYAGSAHLVMPLTRDASVIHSFASELQPKIMPKKGDNPSAALALAKNQLTEAQDKGSVLWIGDGLAEEEAIRIVRQDSIRPASLVMLGAVGMDSESSERRELKQAASVLSARLIFITPDELDVDAIAAQVETDFSSMLSIEEGAQWRDEGYWLLFPILILALFWFRVGWVVRYQ